jgi:hypothetical protein
MALRMSGLSRVRSATPSDGRSTRRWEWAGMSAPY